MNIEKVKSNFQFIGHKITKIEIKNDFVALNDTDSKKMIDVSYEIENAELQNEGWLGTINLFINCKITPKSEEKEDNSSLPSFELSLILNGGFSDIKELDLKTFEKNLRINGCAALYSTARSIVTTYSSLALCEGKIVLPMINVFKMVEHQSDFK